MSDYVVSARKYRPQTFHSVVGQKSLVQTLKNAVTSGKLAHAFLFCGPRGVGKTTCARIFAKTINCEHLTAEGEACNECESCRSFNEQRSFNVYELDAASHNGVDDIRDLIDQVQIPPQIGRYKVFIIDEVHMLSAAAFNAFLKTLEEPPRHAIFVLATTERQKILPTILSRCQTYDFQRISNQDIVDQLSYIAGQENIQYEPQALQVIARKADGGMRDALSIFDQIASFTGGKVAYQATIENLNILDYEVFFRATDAALQGNVPAALMILDGVIRRGFDPQTFIGGWASHIRDLMVCQDAATLSLIEAGQDMAMRYKQQTSQCNAYFLYNALQIANECDYQYRDSRNKRLSVEIAIVRICQINHPVQQPAGTQSNPMGSPRVQQPLQSVNGASSQPQAQAVAARPAAAASPQAAAPQAAAPRPAVAPSRPVATGVPVQQPAVTPAPRAMVAPQPAMPQPSQHPATAAPNPNVGGGVHNRFSPIASTAGAMSPRTTSLNDLPVNNVGNAGAQQSVGQQPLQEENEPVADDALRRAWRAFTKTIPTESFLVNVMLTFQPHLIEGTKYDVACNSQEQVGRIEQRHVEIQNYLRTTLHNSHIEFVCRELPRDTYRRAFTPREKFIEMQQSHPELYKDLVESFGLELA